MYSIYYFIALHLLLQRSLSPSSRLTNYMLVCSRTWFFTVKAEGKRQAGAAPGSALQPSQLLPGKAALTPLPGSGSSSSHTSPAQPSNPSAAAPGRAGHQGPLPFGDGQEVYCAELLFLLWKGKEHYGNQEGSRVCSLLMGAGMA